MFVALGFVTVVAGALATLLLSDSIVTSNFLTAIEKVALLNHVSKNRFGAEKSPTDSLWAMSEWASYPPDSELYKPIIPSSPERWYNVEASYYVDKEPLLGLEPKG